MSKKIPYILLCFVLLFIFQTTLSHAAETYPIIFNGQPSGLSAYIKNETAYLPLRDIVESCCVDINWDNANKQATVSTGLDSTILRLQGGKWYLDGEAIKEDRIPLIRNDQLYLPLRFMAGLCEIELDWDTDKKQVEVNFPLVYADSQWQYYNGRELKPLKKAAGKEVYCTSIRRGEPTTGSDYLWALYPDGQYKRLASDWVINDWQIRDDVCYYLAMQMGFGDKYRVYAVNLTDGTKTQLGNPDYVYNITIKKEGSVYVLPNHTNQPKEWNVTDKGVVITGISKKALSDDVVADEELMRQTYGRYLLTLDGEQTMQQALAE